MYLVLITYSPAPEWRIIRELLCRITLIYVLGRVIIEDPTYLPKKPGQDCALNYYPPKYYMDESCISLLLSLAMLSLSNTAHFSARLS